MIVNKAYLEGRTTLYDGEHIGKTMANLMNVLKVDVL
jgi:hypothetical protein